MTLHEKLVAIQSELKAPKNQRNSFGNYNYRSCEDILEALKPLLKKYDCYLTISDSIIEVSGRVYVQATSTINSKGEMISVFANAREEESKKGMDAAQITGSASSYARKYALNGLFAIDDTKDADATNTHDKTQSFEIPKLPTLAQAIYETTLATDEATLKGVWTKYPEFQKDEKFKVALKNRKEALNNG